jgi:mono/diheme cytochrome c family protein
VLFRSGEELFARSERVIPSCVTCHVQDPAGSPVLDATYPELAASRIEGMDAHEYTFYSIAEPGGYIVEGYGNAMYNRYDDNLNPQDIADLIAYLLSL